LAETPLLFFNFCPGRFNAKHAFSRCYFYVFLRKQITGFIQKHLQASMPPLETGGIMTGGEFAYLAMVLVAFSTFAWLLAFVSWDEKRRQKRLGINWYRDPK